MINNDVILMNKSDVMLMIKSDVMLMIKSDVILMIKSDVILMIKSDVILMIKTLQIRNVVISTESALFWEQNNANLMLLVFYLKLEGPELLEIKKNYNERKFYIFSEFLCN
jgi:hypothetical protein